MRCAADDAHYRAFWVRRFVIFGQSYPQALVYSMWNYVLTRENAFHITTIKNMEGAHLTTC